MITDKGAYLRRCADELRDILLSVDAAQLDLLLDRILGAERVFVAGAGRTLLMLRCFAMALMQMGLCAHVVGDTTTPAIGAGDLLVAASYSGTTKTTSLYAALAKEHGAQIALITAHAASPLGRNADLAVILPAPADSAQYEGNPFEHALVPLFDAVVRFLCARTSTTEADMLRRHANVE